jgi:methylenetetrahydrofolate dehydrogenase (NADP+)/methenyltetrahydrofolate cyclohydrolase
MHLINGKDLAKTIRREVALRVAKLDHVPTLGVLLVGNDPASHLYVSMKKKAAETAGIKMDIVKIETAVTDAELIKQIEAWNHRADIDGILVQLPLPKGHDENAVIAALDPKKDVDGFHPENMRALLAGQQALIPPVHEGVLRLIASTPLTLTGKTAVVIVNSSIFGDPLVHLLKSAGLFVHSMNADELEAQTLRRADVVVIAIGRAKFLHAGITKKDAVIIDVGTNHDEDDELCGDVDMATYEPYEAWVSPVPGGVGPMTIALLLLNVVRVAEAKTQP